MDKAPPTLWLGQLAVLTLFGVACLFVPQAVLASLTGIPSADLSAYAIDMLRLSAPATLGLVGFTLFALMTRRTEMHRWSSDCFAVIFSVLAIVSWLKIAAGGYAGFAVFCAGVVSLLAALNIRAATRPSPEWRPQDDSGIAGTKPPACWMAWLCQLLVLLVGAVVFAFRSEWVLEAISAKSGVAAVPYALDQVDIAAILLAGMALFTGVAMAAQRNYAWRGFAFFFSVFFAIALVTTTWVVVSERYDGAALVLLLPSLVFLAMNVWIRRLQGAWNPEDLAQMPDTWTVMDLVAGPLMAISVLRTKRRSSHLLGVGARGEFRVSADDPRIPNHEFFKAGAKLDVRARFANLTTLDDAGLDVRGFSISFSDPKEANSFDLLMNTGSFSPAFNLISFATFVVSKFLPVSVTEAGVRKNQIAREGGVAGLRRAPESYARLKYYGQIVRYWIDAKSARYQVRYRCVPDDEKPESGLPDEADASHIWQRQRRDDEHRPTNYLREKIKEQIATKGVAMRVQAQFHLPETGDTLEWFNASVDWDEDTCPWLDLGRLELRELMSDGDTETMEFDPGRHPPTLGIPRATNASDYRSLGDSEARVVRVLQLLRAWMYGRFGLPRFGEVVVKH